MNLGFKNGLNQGRFSLGIRYSLGPLNSGLVRENQTVSELEIKLN